jgi:hypothetical protein
MTTGRVRTAIREELHPRRQSAFVGWSAFTATFAAARAITYSIRSGRGPFHDITTGKRHLHHYLWGILTLSLVGAVGIAGEERIRRHPVLSAAYGTALALIVDEFALLLDLKDVYWAKEGRVSVDLAVGVIASTGSVLAGLPILRRLRRNRRVQTVDG